jgi:hypothetical protein
MRCAGQPKPGAMSRVCVGMFGHRRNRGVAAYDAAEPPSDNSPAPRGNVLRLTCRRLSSDTAPSRSVLSFFFKTYSAVNPTLSM